MQRDSFLKCAIDSLILWYVFRHFPSHAPDLSATVWFSCFDLLVHIWSQLASKHPPISLSTLLYFPLLSSISVSVKPAAHVSVPKTVSTPKGLITFISRRGCQSAMWCFEKLSSSLLNSRLYPPWSGFSLLHFKIKFDHRNVTNLFLVAQVCNLFVVFKINSFSVLTLLHILPLMWTLTLTFTATSSVSVGLICRRVGCS